MGVRILAFFAASALFAADEQQLALALKAQSDFDRVSLTASPAVRDAEICVQSQAALLPVASPEELPSVHYRKGYCTLAEAAVTRDSSVFRQAADEFDAAVAAWPGRFSKKSKLPPEPVPSALGALASTARLNAAPGDAPTADAAKNEITSALANPACSAALMSPERCRQVLQTASAWLGWIALGKDDVDEAARRFQGLDTTGWPAWAGGRRAFRDRNYAEAARQCRVALDVWRRREFPNLSEHLGPQPVIPRALADLGGAQLLAGDASAAIVTLDSAIKADPAAARAYWLRARAKEVAGQTAAALTDYNMAARTALANAPENVSGEGSVYRGILLYRRKEFSEAEDEFAAAATRGVPPDLKADATAWRHLAAVASGACGPERMYLERSLAEVSPYFPRQDARAAISACPAGLSSSAADRAK